MSDVTNLEVPKNTYNGLFLDNSHDYNTALATSTVLVDHRRYQ